MGTFEMASNYSFSTYKIVLKLSWAAELNSQKFKLHLLLGNSQIRPKSNGIKTKQAQSQPVFHAERSTINEQSPT